MSNIGSSGAGNMSGTTSRLGQVLQEARRQRGLDIKDIAASTHVRAEYLAALEAGRYSELPENVYTRNFLRLYAEAVGLDEQEVLEQYSQERFGKSYVARKSSYPSPAYDPATESYVSAGAGVSGRSAEGERVSRRRGGAWLVPFLLLALLGSGLYYAWNNWAFQNDDGSYTVGIPGIGQNINIPSFNRSGTGNDNSGTVDLRVPNTDTSLGLSGASEGGLNNSVGTSVGNSVDGVDNGNTNIGTADSGDNSLDTADTAIEGSTGEIEINLPDATSGENAGEGIVVTPLPTEGDVGDGTASVGASVGSVVDGAAITTGLDGAGLDGNEIPGFVLFSIATEPEGARVIIDGFDLGTTPVRDFPLTPSDSKQLNIILEGYEAVEQSFDGTEAQDFFFALEEAVAGDVITVDSIVVNSDGTIVASDDPTNTALGVTDASLEGKVVITIEDGGEAWLEVYSGTTRGGETLVYRVANDSDRFEFDMPVFVRAGRSSLVQVSVNGASAEPLGPPDEVAEQVFNQ